MSPLIEARGLTRSFVWKGSLGRRRRLLAVREVDLELGSSECLALVGESGSGKTTLGRCLLRLIEPDAGSILFEGEDLLTLAPRELRRRRQHFQMVFQNSSEAFNPRLRVEQILAEPFEIHGIGSAADRRGRLMDLLAKVGLGDSVLRRYAHQLSGGQRQRLGIARSLAAEPKLLVLDEPVAALDVSVQARILHLLARLRDDLGLAMVFISHDLAVVQQIAERVAVLYLGRIVETGCRDEIFRRPRHPYTVSLLASVPVADPARRAMPQTGRSGAPATVGEVPSPLDPPPGCPFHPRCPIARDRCRSEEPQLRGAGGPHRVACHYPGELTAPTSAGELSAPNIVG